MSDISKLSKIIMKDNELVFCFIKFGKRKYLESLLNNGELFFNSTKSFNEIKVINSEQGDENEGAIWIKNIQLSRVKLSHPTLGEFNFKSIEGKLSKLTQFNHNYLTCSFYIITTKDFENTNSIKIDKRMAEFGEYALIIKNPKLFLDNLIGALNAKEKSFVAKKVEYIDLSSKGRIEMNPFLKKIEHQYQKEYRIILKNITEPKILQIKGVKKNGKIVKTNEIIESNWEIVRD